MCKEKETKILYPVCVYMIENKESFKDYKIYEDILKDAISPKEKDSYIQSDYNDTQSLYHKLLNTYRFLAGTAVDKKEIKDPCIPLGYYVMPRIDSWDGDERGQELLQEVSYWMAVCYDYLQKGGKVTRYNKNRYKNQLRKIDVNKTFSLLDELVEKINAEYVENLVGWQEHLWLDNDSKQEGDNKPEPTEYFKIQEGLYDKIRREVLEWPERNGRFWRDILGMEEATCIDNIDSLTALRWFRRHFHNGLEKIFPDYYLENHFGNLCVAYIAWLYVDLCCHVILQSVNRRLVTNPYLSHEDRMQRLHALNDFIGELVQEMKIPSVSIYSEGTRDENMFCFFAYYHMKDKYLQDTYMLKYLKERCGSRKNVKENYSLLYKDEQGCFSFRNQLTSEERYQYFTEGEKVSERSFYTNIKNCESGIAELEKRAGRSFPNKEIALKSFYREIYLDKTMYGRQQSKTIFNMFVEDRVIKTSAYYFIDEKINMGICRELGVMDEFWLKNTIQENLYHLVCIVLTELRPLNIMAAFDEAIEKLTSKMKEVLSMFVYDPNLEGYQWVSW